MSYSSINLCVNDGAFMGRLIACCADEGEENPYQVAESLKWDVATADDIEAAYASALAAENPNPGGDEAVITDQQILSAVQANLP
jgi:hypothetical protein